LIDLTILWKLLAATLLGACVGIERESHGRSAGLRTHALVSLAMCLLMVLSVDIPWEFSSPRFMNYMRMDPARLAAGALAGMGFIGAGVVLKGRGSVRGVTTAASLWLVSAIGMTMGLGYWREALLATALALAVLIGLAIPERHVRRHFYTRLEVSGALSVSRLCELKQILHGFGIRILFTGTTAEPAHGRATFRFALRYKSPLDWDSLMASLAKVPGVERLEWGQGKVP